MIADGYGGAIVTWVWGGYTLWAQHVGTNGIAATVMALVSSDAGPDRVSLVWQGSGVNAVSLERSTDGAAWNDLARMSPDRDGFVRYEDRAITAGQRYGYRLRYAADSGSTTTAETWVLLPGRYTLALAGFRPNPTTGANLAISFELPSTAPGKLELLDVTGRRIVERGLSAYVAGRYTERLGAGTPVPAGVYWLRLTHGARVLTARGVVLR